MIKLRYNLKAREIDSFRGKRVFKVPVVIRLNDSRSCSTLAEQTILVIAHSPADAANWTVDTLNRPETEVFAYGPQGGQTYRYMGWESCIGRAMFNRPVICAKQLELTF